MFARMIVTGLLALSLSSIPPLYSAGGTPTPQTIQTTQADIQQPQSANPSKGLRIFIEEDFSTAQMLKRELTDWGVRIGIPIIFVEKDVEPYDLRILLTSSVGSDSGSCSTSCSPSGSDCSSCSSSCSVTYGEAPEGRKVALRLDLFDCERRGDSRLSCLGLFQTGETSACRPISPDSIGVILRDTESSRR
jgi:hypothetical protein